MVCGRREGKAHSWGLMDEDARGEEGRAEGLDVLLRERGIGLGLGDQRGDRGGEGRDGRHRIELPPHAPSPHLAAQELELLAPPAAVREAPPEHGRLDVEPAEELADGGVLPDKHAQPREDSLSVPSGAQARQLAGDFPHAARREDWWKEREAFGCDTGRKAARALASATGALSSAQCDAI